MRLAAGIVGALLLTAPAAATVPADPNNYRGVWTIKGETSEASCLATLKTDVGTYGWILDLPANCPASFRLPPGLTHWHVAPKTSAVTFTDGAGKTPLAFDYQPGGIFMTGDRPGGKLRLLWDKTLNPGIE